MHRPLAAALLLAEAGAALAAAPVTGLSTTSEALAALPELRLPAAEVKTQVASLKHEPLRFAVEVPLGMDERNGRWDAPLPGLSRWQLRIESDAARSLALELRDVKLPAGAELWFYDSTGRDVQGPFAPGSAEVRTGHLPLVRGHTAVLEVLVPTVRQQDVRFRIESALHGYRGLFASSGENQPKAAIGSDSGSCNINVACTEGDNWRNEIRSTVLLTIGGTTLCTGTLVNNTSQNDRPLILTANHCGLRDTNVATTRAYFNTQSATCAGNDDGRTDQNILGSTFLARDENSDFTLFALGSTPPAAYNVYYAGWDVRSGVAPQSGVTMHHPSGDEKKISVYSSAASATAPAASTSIPGRSTGRAAPPSRARQVADCSTRTGSWSACSPAAEPRAAARRSRTSSGGWSGPTRPTPRVPASSRFISTRPIRAVCSSPARIPAPLPWRAAASSRRPPPPPRPAPAAATAAEAAAQAWV